VVALAALLLGLRLLPQGKGQAVAWQDLTSQVGPLVIVHAEHRLFRDRAGLVRYLKGAKATRSAPAVDLSARELLLVAPGPRSSTGYSVEVVSARERGGKITVRVRELSPRRGENVQPRVTYPYRLISLPAGKVAYVDWLGR
jgi:hypothetical protein